MSLTELNDKFAALSSREKSLLAGTAVIIIVLLGFTFLIEPSLKSIKSLQIELEMAENQHDNLNAQKALFDEALKEDPDAELKTTLRQLELRQQRLGEKFAKQLSELVSPAEMALLINQVFNHAKELKLEEMASVAPENLFADAPDMEGVVLYQHGLRLTFSGTFFPVKQFLDALEKQTHQLYWRSIHYEVKAYPQAQVTLEVYTLSSDKAFIGVR